jgi:hypothetical protein
VKHAEEIMEILEAFDLTRSYRSAAELAGCDHHTVAHWVARRDAGELTATAVRRDQLIDPFLAKLEEWMEASKGKVRADVAHDKLVALGYGGSERTTRRAVAAARKSWLAGNRRVHRPWVPEPGLWFQWDFGTGPIVDGKATLLFCAWLAWSRFRVIIPIRDRSLPTVVAAIDATLRRFGGCPTYGLTENVPRNIFRVMWPARLCSRRRRRGCDRGGRAAARVGSRPHNAQSESSQLSSDSSDCQTGRVRGPAEEPGGSVARRASTLALVLISA